MLPWANRTIGADDVGDGPFQLVAADASGAQGVDQRVAVDDVLAECLVQLQEDWDSPSIVACAVVDMALRPSTEWVRVRDCDSAF